jgi:hypothetical protein
MRDFLHSEIANLYGMPNIPDDPDLAIDVGTHLCVEILEPLQQQFGRVADQIGVSLMQRQSVRQRARSQLRAQRNQLWRAYLGSAQRRRPQRRNGVRRRLRASPTRVAWRRLALARVVDSRPSAVFGGRVLSEASARSTSAGTNAHSAASTATSHRKAR